MTKKIQKRAARAVVKRNTKLQPRGSRAEPRSPQTSRVRLPGGNGQMSHNSFHLRKYGCVEDSFTLAELCNRIKSNNSQDFAWPQWMTDEFVSKCVSALFDLVMKLMSLDENRQISVWTVVEKSKTDSLLAANSRTYEKYLRAKLSQFLKVLVCMSTSTSTTPRNLKPAQLAKIYIRATRDADVATHTSPLSRSTNSTGEETANIDASNPTIGLPGGVDGTEPTTYHTTEGRTMASQEIGSGTDDKKRTFGRTPKSSLNETPLELRSTSTLADEVSRTPGTNTVRTFSRQNEPGIVDDDAEEEGTGEHKPKCGDCNKVAPPENATVDAASDVGLVTRGKESDSMLRGTVAEPVSSGFDSKSQLLACTDSAFNSVPGKTTVPTQLASTHAETDQPAKSKLARETKAEKESESESTNDQVVLLIQQMKELEATKLQLAEQVKSLTAEQAKREDEEKRAVETKLDKLKLEYTSDCKKITKLSDHKKVVTAASMFIARAGDLPKDSRDRRDFIDMLNYVKHRRARSLYGLGCFLLALREYQLLLDNLADENEKAVAIFKLGMIKALLMDGTDLDRVRVLLNEINPMMLKDESRVFLDRAKYLLKSRKGFPPNRPVEQWGMIQCDHAIDSLSHLFGTEYRFMFSSYLNRKSALLASSGFMWDVLGIYQRLAMTNHGLRDIFVEDLSTESPFLARSSCLSCESHRGYFEEKPLLYPERSGPIRLLKGEAAVLSVWSLPKGSIPGYLNALLSCNCLETACKILEDVLQHHQEASCDWMLKQARMLYGRKGIYQQARDKLGTATEQLELVRGTIRARSALRKETNRSHPVGHLALAFQKACEARRTGLQHLETQQHVAKGAFDLYGQGCLLNMMEKVVNRQGWDLASGWSIRCDYALCQALKCSEILMCSSRSSTIPHFESLDRIRAEANDQFPKAFYALAVCSEIHALKILANSFELDEHLETAFKWLERALAYFLKFLIVVKRDPYLEFLCLDEHEYLKFHCMEGCFRICDYLANLQYSFDSSPWIWFGLLEEECDISEDAFKRLRKVVLATVATNNSTGGSDSRACLLNRTVTAAKEALDHAFSFRPGDRVRWFVESKEITIGDKTGWNNHYSEGKVIRIPTHIGHMVLVKDANGKRCSYSPSRLEHCNVRKGDLVFWEWNLELHEGRVVAEAELGKRACVTEVVKRIEEDAQGNETVKEVRKTWNVLVALLQVQSENQ